MYELQFFSSMFLRNNDDNDDDDNKIIDRQTICDDIRGLFPLFPSFYLDLPNRGTERRTDTSLYRCEDTYKNVYGSTGGGVGSYESLLVPNRFPNVPKIGTSKIIT